MNYNRAMTPDVASRAQARALGLTRFFTGTPCVYGHICERYVSSNGCVECIYIRYHGKAQPPKPLKTCPCCGREFISYRKQKYCSGKCRGLFSWRLHRARYPDRIRLRSFIYYSKQAAIKLSSKVCLDCGDPLPVPRVKYCSPCGKERRRKSRKCKDNARKRLICADAYNRYQSRRHAHLRAMRSMGLLRPNDNKWLALRAAKELGIL